MPLAVVDGSSRSPALACGASVAAHPVETCPAGRLSEKNNILDCSVLREEQKGSLWS